jgi:hypothetical protein
MYKIEYNIGLNEQGRPYIELPEDYEHQPEDRFFVIEIARWMLQDLLTRRIQDLDQQIITAIDESERVIGQIGDEVAGLLYGNMKAQGELNMMLDKLYHINVKSIEERDALPNKEIFFNGKLFDRVEGLRVQLNSDPRGENKYFYRQHDFSPIIEIYELVDGITNDHWVKLSTEEINEKLDRNDK